MLAFAGRDGNLYRKDISGGKEELILKNANQNAPSGWSKDGRYLLYTEVDPKKTEGDIWVLPEPKPLFEQIIAPVVPQFNLFTCSPAPDGQRFPVLTHPEVQETIHLLTNSAELIGGKK